MVHYRLSPTSATSPPAMRDHPTLRQRRAMRMATLAQCFGALGLCSFTCGIVLVYLTSLGYSSAGIMFLLALPTLCEALLRLPLAYLADQWGKRRLGRLGILCSVVGYAGLWLGGIPEAGGLRHLLVISGLVVYGVGLSAFGAGWYALLSPIVPQPVRGRFFGRLRLTWQVVAVIFAFIATLILSKTSPFYVFLLVLLAINLGLLTRYPFYSRLPELEKPRPAELRLLPTLRAILPVNNFASFCCYVFLLMLFTACVPTCFGLIEKQVLNLGDRLVVVFGNLTMVGSIFGFWAGGKAVDRWGTKVVFVGCHLLYGLVIGAFMLRTAVPGLMLVWIGLLHVAFGIAYAGSSIAIATEMLALVPPLHKSLSTSLNVMLMQIGIALSGLLSGWMLKLGVFAAEWQLGPLTMTRYDSILFCCSGMVVLLVVTLGLVPSVIRKAEWFPRSL